MACKYSLIIPVYQVKAYIVECLESIFCQIPADVQVILVDDGSTDGSGEICDEYARRYPQIEVIHQRNQGVAAARNAGLAVAKGEYLLWVDPDDWVTDDWFDKISYAVERYAPDVVVFDSLRVSEQKRHEEIYGRDEGFVDKDVFCQDIARDIRMLSGMPNKVIRTSLFQGIRFDCSLSILEDYSLILSVVENAQHIYYIRSILYFYRQHDSSLIHHHEPEKSFLSVKIAERRRDTMDIRYGDAAVVGVAIQAFMYCRESACDKRYSPKSKEYKYCRRLICENFRTLWQDQEITLRWKLKFLLLKLGVLPQIVRMREVLRNI